MDEENHQEGELIGCEEKDEKEECPHREDPLDGEGLLGFGDAGQEGKLVTLSNSFRGTRRKQTNGIDSLKNAGPRL